MSKRVLTTLTLIALACALAACGSSQAPGIQPAPSGGLTAAAATTPAPVPTTPAAPTATTPKPPSPLATKPIVSVSKAPAPKQLVVKDLIKGTGPSAKAGSTITVNYVGVLYKTGKQFDASWTRNQPFSTPLSITSVIPGWVKGIPGMKVGGRRELIIPPSLAYGAKKIPGIPPNSPLVFVVDLLSVG